MSDCIETTNAHTDFGYGQCSHVRFGTVIHLAHVLAWIDAHGCLPPEDKPYILHTCDNPPCINPEHLYAGTQEDNVRDSVARGRHHNKNKTFCKNGHEFTSENTYIQPSNGQRHCRTCQQISHRKRGK